MSKQGIVSVGGWIITLILLSIPIFNIILALYWAFSSGTNANRQNFARAILVIFFIYIILFYVFAGFFAASMDSMMQYI